MLYFLKPLVLIKTSINRCEIDQTIETSNDTARIGISFFSKEAMRIDSISFANNVELNEGVSPLFIEKSGKLWVCRFFVRLPKRDVMDFFTGDSPELCFFSVNESSVCLRVNEKQWDKVKRQCGDLYTIINLN